MHQDVKQQGMTFKMTPITLRLMILSHLEAEDATVHAHTAALNQVVGGHLKAVRRCTHIRILKAPPQPLMHLQRRPHQAQHTSTISRPIPG
jgi:hypothetical protein